MAIRLRLLSLNQKIMHGGARGIDIGTLITCIDRLRSRPASVDLRYELFEISCAVQKLKNATSIIIFQALCCRSSRRIAAASPTHIR
jgi:hypothetical protein